MSDDKKTRSAIMSVELPLGAGKLVAWPPLGTHAMRFALVTGDGTQHDIGGDDFDRLLAMVRTEALKDLSFAFDQDGEGNIWDKLDLLVDLLSYTSESGEKLGIADAILATAD